MDVLGKDVLIDLIEKGSFSNLIDVLRFQLGIDFSSFFVKSEVFTL